MHAVMAVLLAACGLLHMMRLCAPLPHKVLGFRELYSATDILVLPGNTTKFGSDAAAGLYLSSRDMLSA